MPERSVASGVAVTRADIPFFLEMLVTLMCGSGTSRGH